MGPCHINRLPEELLLQILDYLDSPAPSHNNLRQEPSLSLTASESSVYKHASSVSQQSRRLTLPLLFRHTRLRLDQPVRKQWSKCLLCNQGGLDFRMKTGKTPPAPEYVDKYHKDMLEDVAALLQQGRESTYDPSSVLPTLAPIAESTDDALANFLTWAPRFYHGLKDFLNFLESQELASSVRTFTLMTDKMLPVKLDRFPHLAAETKDWRYKCSAAFWQHLLSVTSSLETVTIVAPPIDLACLTNCAIDTFGDWAFGDMDFHSLSISVPPSSGHQPSSSTLPERAEPVEYGDMQYLPHRYPGLARHSILSLRPWRTISINEGAFLKAYGTYEYFERGPPSLIYSIKDSLAPRPIYNSNAQRISEVPLQGLRVFKYTGIFPFANHLDFRELLPQLEELELQLAPEPGSNILQDPARVGKAQMEDVWSELITVYQHLASLLSTMRISERNVPRLKRFTCRDSRIVNLREELDEVFVPLCLPVWAEYEDGTFIRLKDSADVPEYANVSWAD